VHFTRFVSSLQPLSVEQALEDPDWIIAMEEELNNFKRNEVWEVGAKTQAKCDRHQMGF
jgi:hypothetical protein